MLPKVLESEPSIDQPFAYVQEYNVNTNSSAILAAGRHIASAKEMEKETGIRLPVVAGIRASDKEFLILDTRDQWSDDQPFMLVDGEFSTKNKVEYKGLYNHQEVIIGRANDDRFSYPPTVSSRHFSIVYQKQQDQFVIADLDSTNGTTVTGYVDLDSQQRLYDDRIDDRYTRNFGRHVLRDRQYDFGDEDAQAPYGYYKNHAIIGRNSRSVRDGVYGTSSSECVVVDDKNNLIRKITADFVRELNRADTQTLSYLNVLTLAEFQTANVMHYDKDAVEALSSPYYDNNGLIMMSDYVREGVGVCRHQALLVAHLVEEAIGQRIIGGSVGVERNHDLEARGAHAWAVYRPVKGADVIIDPAQHFVGTRKRAEQEKRWRYKVSSLDDSQTLG